MVREIKLNDGKTMPALSWGNMGGKEKALNAGALALKAGILHIDTAQIYFTEEEAHGAIEKAGLSRDKVWITTKISTSSKPKTELEDIRRSVKESLAKLTFIPDLILIHNPYIPAAGRIAEFWGYLEQLVEDGTLNGCSLGVSNFRPQDLAELENAKIKPVVNREPGAVALLKPEIEFHPYLLAHLDPVMEYHKKHHIVAQAYGPLSPILRHPTGGPLKPVLTKIAKKLTEESGVQVDESGVLILWTIQKGVVCITSSQTPERITRMADTEKVRDLTAAEIKEIDTAGRQIHFRAYPEHMNKDLPLPDLPEDV